MSNGISWYSSSDTGAPVMNNAAGSLDAVLYACLQTGYNTSAVGSISVASGLATVTHSSHGFGDYQTVQISGATPPELNGTHMVRRTGSGSYTFATTAADGAASGSIVAKRPALGWTRVLNSGNVSMYSRTNVSATAMSLRIDDSGSGAAGAIYARARMVEAYSDLNTFTNPAPRAADYDGFGYYVHKGANSGAAKPWVLVGNSKSFWLFTDQESYPQASYGGLAGGMVFGDAASDRAGDAYHCLIDGQGSASGAANGHSLIASHSALNGSSPFTAYFARPVSGVGGAIGAGVVGRAGSNAGTAGGHYPEPASNGFRLDFPLLLRENLLTLNFPIRGVLPGVAAPLCRAPSADFHLKIFDGVIGSSRVWLGVGARTGPQTFGALLFDITGPW